MPNEDLTPSEHEAVERHLALVKDYAESHHMVGSVHSADMHEYYQGRRKETCEAIQASAIALVLLRGRREEEANA